MSYSSEKIQIRMMLSDLFVIKIVIEDILLGVFDPRAKKNKGQTMALKKLPLEKKLGDLKNETRANKRSRFFWRKKMASNQR